MGNSFFTHTSLIEFFLFVLAFIPKMITHILCDQIKFAFQNAAFLPI